jgi:hypothetical protein
VWSGDRESDVISDIERCLSQVLRPQSERKSGGERLSSGSTFRPVLVRIREKNTFRERERERERELSALDWRRGQRRDDRTTSTWSLDRMQEESGLGHACSLGRRTRRGL